MANFEELKTAMGDLDEVLVLQILGEVAADGGDSATEALAACQAGMDIVGEKYESGEYFVADLIFAGDLMAEAAALLKPLLADTETISLGKLVLATVKGDIHDIGKNIVKALIEAAGIEVFDLGVDVGAEAIVGCLQESGAQVLALSGVLTFAVESMTEIVAAVKAAGFDDVKVIVGGAPVTAEYCEIIGADAWSINAAEGAGICRDWLSA
ncbi:MAG: cobalamin-dependent protein [Coriobacteriales bacterium]|jgi:methanogenic corrinoid protein MtbC1|nr:cobalamin-dependent protein [Coriobacteriales bacterium]